jgi:hypothetical protein
VKQFRIVLVALAAVLLIGGRPLRGQTEQPLTNADIVTMLHADLGDGVIIAKIQQAPAEALDVSTGALVSLKKAGASKGVIEAMVKRTSSRSSANSAVAPAAPAPPKAPAAQVPPKAPAATSRSEASSPQAPATSALAACQQAFKAEGGFWKGAAFQTSFPIPPGKEAVVFETLMQALAGSNANWQNLSLSKEAGLITAVEDMAEIMGHKTLRAPLKILVKKGPDGIAKTVEMLFQVPSGTKAPESGVKKVLCDQIAASLDAP